MNPSPVIVTLSAEQTHDLRRRVLRAGTPGSELRWPGDDDPGTLHLGIVSDGVVVAISTWLRSGSAIQLRGMATEPDLAGSGLGRRLLNEGIERAADSGAELVWANARVTAVGFYERFGFITVGEVFTTPEVGLPHLRVERTLSVPPI